MLVIGVHPIKAREPVHLLEVDLSGFEGEIEWRGFTQPLAGRDSGYYSEDRAALLELPQEVEHYEVVDLQARW